MSDKRKHEAVARIGSERRSQGESPGVEPAAPGTPTGPLALGQRWTTGARLGTSQCDADRLTACAETL